MTGLPSLALSVRQPWAWAIIHGGKVIENRSLQAIRAGGMDCRTICIHAASGMSEKEYRWGFWRLEQHGVACPRPETLIRSAIIGIVDVVDVITHSDSEWFGGKAGLVLEHPRSVHPIPCRGALGYFEWQREGQIAEPKPWMQRFGRSGQDNATPDLFPDAPLKFATPPRKPWAK